MVRKKRVRRKKHEYQMGPVDPFNATFVLGGLLALGVYFMMKSCETYDDAKASPLEDKVRQVETVNPSDKPYSISEVIYKN